MLGSGSQGNAALLMTPTLHVLIDAGFLPDDLAARMEGTGASWDSLDAVILTHTHGDHLKKKCLKRCAEHGVRFVCHEHHVEQLGGGRYFKRLFETGLVQTYDGTHEFRIVPQVHEAVALAVEAGIPALAAESAAPYAEAILPRRHAAMEERSDALVFHPILVPHDCPPTFGFRIEAALADRTLQIGYLADLGECDEHIAEQMYGVDLLALEFNHDVGMQVRSGRHPRLIERCLGREGHLSNVQAANVLQQVIEKSSTPPQVVIQLHLSEECNKPELAYRAAQEAVLLSGAQTKVYSSRQDQRGTIHEL
jgi:phosphoribosyl 1,2-cyclic phosphodiesterase